MSTENENSENSLFIVEKEGKYKKIAYKSNLIDYLNKETEKKYEEVLKKDFNCFIKILNDNGYKIYRLIEI